MSLPHHNENFCWYNDLEECKPHYTPVKVKNILQFFTLRGKATTLIKDNLTPLEHISYAYLAEGKYYMKHYRGWSYDDMVYDQDEAIRILRARMDAGTVWLMFTLKDIADISELLKKVYRGRFKQEGKLEYPLYLHILETNIAYEDYKLTGKGLTGFKTVCNQYEKQLAELWGKAKND